MNLKIINLKSFLSIGLLTIVTIGMSAIESEAAVAYFDKSDQIMYGLLGSEFNDVGIKIALVGALFAGGLIAAEMFHKRRKAKKHL